MYVTKILESLPLLANYGKDIDVWLNEFQTIMELWEINKPERIIVFMKQCVTEDIKIVIDNLKAENNSYPSLKEIKTAIENYLDINDHSKYWNLKSMKIQLNEPLKLFNINYLKKYYDININYRKLISVEDYINSIKMRTYPCLYVLEKDCNSIEEAIKCSNRADKIEKILCSENSLPQRVKLDEIKISDTKIFINQNCTHNNCEQKINDNKKIMCFKCYELGHKAEKCHYSYRELAIMEENGTLAENRNKNYDPNYKYRNNKNKNENSNNKNRLLKNNSNNFNLVNKYGYNIFNRRDKYIKDNYHKYHPTLKKTNMKFNYMNKNNYKNVNYNYKRKINDYNINYNMENVNNNVNKNKPQILNNNKNKIKENNIVNIEQNSEISSNLSESDSQCTLTTNDHNIEIYENDTMKNKIENIDRNESKNEIKNRNSNEDPTKNISKENINASSHPLAQSNKSKIQFNVKENKGVKYKHNKWKNNKFNKKKNNEHFKLRDFRGRSLV